MKISKSFLIMIVSFAAMIALWGTSISSQHPRYVIAAEEKGKKVGLAGARTAEKGVATNGTTD